MSIITDRIEEQISVLEKTAAAMSETARMIAIKATQVTQTAMDLAMQASRLLGQAADLKKLLAVIASELRD